ncbi:hypothetical protein HMPREF9103_01325 [Lentilactobacillus parafarraginis F0439]|uniref:Uncharacterized protein n=1 Tax=Lentilactobacillus parafarraginis F0439 TaxID=797515 RepID=G9ZNM2_9LACO|nr:hypothetical protein [Lentilactobacillus parafarraginis]EHL98770.1 hypothetical protein HMPREF9103_01325 [Lentilactobacillus parafarraginis F0439]
MPKQPYTEARKRANKKWDAAHKERTRYISRRSTARNFIKNLAAIDDLAEFRSLISARETQLNEQDRSQKSDHLNERKTDEK